MQIITNWWGVNHLLFEWHFVFWTHPTFQAQNRKWKFWPQFRIFIPYLMKSATSIKVSYINEIDMSSSIHKMNAINILPIYTPQITSQTPGSPFISKFWPGLSFETIPCHLKAAQRTENPWAPTMGRYMNIEKIIVFPGALICELMWLV